MLVIIIVLEITNLLTFRHRHVDGRHVTELLELALGLDGVVHRHFRFRSEVRLRREPFEAERLRLSIASGCKCKSKLLSCEEALQLTSRLPR